MVGSGLLILLSHLPLLSSLPSVSSPSSNTGLEGEKVLLDVSAYVGHRGSTGDAAPGLELREVGVEGRMEGQAAPCTHLGWEATEGLWPRSKSPNQRAETGIGGWLKKEKPQLLPSLLAF